MLGALIFSHSPIFLSVLSPVLRNLFTWPKSLFFTSSQIFFPHKETTETKLVSFVYYQQGYQSRSVTLLKIAVHFPAQEIKQNLFKIFKNTTANNKLLQRRMESEGGKSCIDLNLHYLHPNKHVFFSSLASDGTKSKYSLFHGSLKVLVHAHN